MVIITNFIIQWEQNELSNYGIICCCLQKKELLKAAERLSNWQTLSANIAAAKELGSKLLGTYGHCRSRLRERRVLALCP